MAADGDGVTTTAAAKGQKRIAIAEGLFSGRGPL